MAQPAPEPVCLHIEPDPHHRIARIHEALRDLGLELCSACGIWKGTERFPIVLSPAATFARTTCAPCIAITGDLA